LSAKRKASAQSALRCHLVPLLPTERHETHELPLRLDQTRPRLSVTAFADDQLPNIVPGIP
jgi:hypothetical protein